MNISALSIKELKALLARVESDLADIDNEHKICKDRKSTRLNSSH